MLAIVNHRNWLDDSPPLILNQPAVLLSFRASRFGAFNSFLFKFNQVGNDPTMSHPDFKHNRRQTHHA